MNKSIEKLVVVDNKAIMYVFSSITINKVISDLQSRGFTRLFKQKQECICCDDYNIGFDEFDIVEVHSLETASPNTHHVVYAVKCDKYNIKGILVSAVENYANTFLNIYINKIIHSEKLEFKYYNAN